MNGKKAKNIGWVKFMLFGRIFSWISCKTKEKSRGCFGRRVFKEARLGKWETGLEA